MCKFKMRIFSTVFVFICLTALVRAEELDSEGTTTEKSIVDNGTSTGNEESTRPQRSIGKLTRLLLGGTYVMVQLGQMPPNHPLVRYPEAVHKANGKDVLAAVPGKVLRAHIPGLPNPLGSSRGFSSQPPVYQQILEGDKAQAVDQPLASLTASNSQSDSYYSGQAESQHSTNYPQGQAHPSGNYPPGHYEHEQPERHYETEPPQPPGADSYDATYSGGGRAFKESNRHDFHGSVSHPGGPAQSYSYPSYDYPGEGYYPTAEQPHQHEPSHPTPPPHHHPSTDYQPLQVHHPQQAPHQAEIAYRKASQTEGGPIQNYPPGHEGSHRGADPFIKIEPAPAYSHPDSFYEPAYSEYQNPYPRKHLQNHNTKGSGNYSPAPGNAEGYSLPDPNLPKSESSYSRPESGYSRPEPSFSKTEPGYSRPEPGFSKTEPGYSRPEPSYSRPEPSYSRPEHGHSRPESGYFRPEPGHSRPESGYSGPDPGHSQPNPGYSPPDPGYSEPNMGFFQPTDRRYSQHTPQESIATYTKILPTTPLIAMPIKEEEPGLKVKHPYLLDHPLVITPPQFKNFPPWPLRPRFAKRPQNRPENFFQMPRFQPNPQIFHNAPNHQMSKQILIHPQNDPRDDTRPPPHLIPNYPPNHSESSNVNLPVTSVSYTEGGPNPTVRYPPHKPNQHHNYPAQSLPYPSESPNQYQSPTNSPTEDSYSVSSTLLPEKEYIIKNYPNKTPTNSPPPDWHPQPNNHSPHSRPVENNNNDNRPLPSAFPSESPYPYKKHQQPSPTKYPIRDSIPSPEQTASRYQQVSTPKYTDTEDDSYPRVYTHPTSKSSKSNRPQSSRPHSSSYSSKNNRYKNKSYKSTSQTESINSKYYSKSRRPNETSYKSKSKYPSKSSKYKSSNGSLKNYRKPPPPFPPNFVERPLTHYTSEVSSDDYKHARASWAQPKYHGPDFKQPDSASSYPNSAEATPSYKHPQGDPNLSKYSEPPVKYFKISEPSASAYPKLPSSSYYEDPKSGSSYPKSPEILSDYPNSPEKVSPYPQSPEQMSHYPKTPEQMSQYPKTPERVPYYSKTSKTVSYFPRISESVFVHPENPPPVIIHPPSSEVLSIEISPSYYISSEVLSDYYKQFEPPAAPGAVNYSPPAKFTNYQNSNEYLSHTFSKKSLLISSSNPHAKSPSRNSTFAANKHSQPTAFQHPRNHTKNSNQNESHPRSSRRRQYRKADYYSDDDSNSKVTSTTAPPTTTVPSTTSTAKHTATTQSSATKTTTSTTTTTTSQDDLNPSTITLLSEIQFEETTSSLIPDDIDTPSAESSTLSL